MSEEPVGNAANGKKIFARNCANCHNAVPKGKNAIGPALYGVWGRKIATGAGFKYTGGLSGKKNQVWTADLLDKWLENPAAFSPGTTMAFAGLKNEEERKDVIRYLFEAKPKK